jgi:integrase
MAKRTNTAAWLENQQRWQIKVQKDGVRRTFTSSKPGRTGQREANAKADAWLDDGIENQRLTVAQVYRAFLDEKRSTTSASNFDPMASRWKNHIEPVIGRKKVATLTENDLQNVINQAYTRSNLSKKSLESLRSDLTAFCRYCRKGKLLTLFPESLTIPTTAAKPEKQVLQPRDFVVLFNTDQTRFRGKVVHDDLIHAYRIAVLTGLRPGELRGLRWGDVKADRIELRRSVNRYNAETDGKNENAKRTVELSALARQEMAAQRQETDDHSPAAPVFDIPTLKQYETHLARFCAHNGLPACTPYELRHTFVSIAKRLPVGLVKSLVGHSENMDTFAVYGHDLDGDSAARAAALDDAFARIFASEK